MQACGSSTDVNFFFMLNLTDPEIYRAHKLLLAVEHLLAGLQICVGN